MSKPIRTAEEMREAAARIVDCQCPNRAAALAATSDMALAAACGASPCGARDAAAIRALPVADAADDEVLVERCANALRRLNPHAPEREKARAVLAVLREAGALR